MTRVTLLRASERGIIVQFLSKTPRFMRTCSSYEDTWRVTEEDGETRRKRRRQAGDEA